MLFSSTIFLFAFLPISILGYYLLRRWRKANNIFLLLMSLFFYAWGEPKFVLVMLLSIFMNYLFGLWINRVRKTKWHARLVLCIMLVFNLSVFFIFKYLNFTVSSLNQFFDLSLPQTNIILPIGISFFTFQAMSYVFDVYMERGVVQKNPLYVGLYVSFFPQLIAGPIVRYQTIADQILERVETLEDFTIGVRRLAIGLSKKVLISNTMAVIAEKAFSIEDFSNLSVSFAWLGILAYAFQIYFDFSGYSDMAIGMGKMFGFHFDENFSYPYVSKSISEFWRRWHISLGTWFRDYVYFPLGGSRVKSKSRLLLNLFVVWFLTGLWHGANWTFIAWGLMYFVLIAFEKLSGYPNKFKSHVAILLYRIFTVLCILGGWVLFRAPGMTHALRYILSMVGLNQNALIDGNATIYFSEFKFFYLVAILCAMPLIPWLQKKISDKPKLLKIALIASQIALFLLVVASVTYLVKGTYNPFIYFNF